MNYEKKIKKSGATDGDCTLWGSRANTLPQALQVPRSALSMVLFLEKLARQH
jgi:hypothetical protein